MTRRRCATPNFGGIMGWVFERGQSGDNNNALATRMKEGKRRNDDDEDMRI